MTGWDGADPEQKMGAFLGTRTLDSKTATERNGAHARDIDGGTNSTA